MLAPATVGAFALCAITWIGIAPDPTPTDPATTLQDLQFAYNLEVNARESYLAFAERADADGYKKVGSLFRAVARAEQVHALNHADEIRRFDGTPTATIEEPIVRRTLENLQTSIARESHERDVMYTMFANQAGARGLAGAECSFDRARCAEAQHAKLFSEARSGLKLMKRAQTFYVCPGCGATVSELDAARCLGCGAGPEAFEPIG